MESDRSQQAGAGAAHPVVGPVEMQLTASVGLSDRSVAVAARETASGQLSVMLGNKHSSRALRAIFCNLSGVGRPTLIRRPARPRFARLAQGRRRHGLEQANEICAVGKPTIHRGSGTGLESPFSDSALPCQPQLTETETEVLGALLAACHPLCVASLCRNCFSAS